MVLTLLRYKRGRNRYPFLKANHYFIFLQPGIQASVYILSVVYHFTYIINFPFLLFRKMPILPFPSLSQHIKISTFLAVYPVLLHLWRRFSQQCHEFSPYSSMLLGNSGPLTLLIPPYPETAVDTPERNL